ncbi:type II toxin-antitoxin system RelE/ParE family toxin [Candidatus Magnetomonas plexicatena]|uniref:type II toxin-antitoxin system RelE/ParE family toxin n=1 Tax=Candidatus Magnetomonas plexicatena TaxID=2552947 RepID=UPI001C766DD2|nr:type II toxin-antitoxin system mRNA interferase toxin, RelE/StbE family [Nitrospirales bacterium LBB_01]
MPKLNFKKPFVRKASKITKNSPPLTAKLSKTLETLRDNPFTPSLKTHKLFGNLSDRYACSLTEDIRITFKLSDDTVHLLNIGSHDIVYD